MVKTMSVLVNTMRSWGLRNYTTGEMGHQTSIKKECVIKQYRESNVTRVLRKGMLDNTLIYLTQRKLTCSFEAKNFYKFSYFRVATVHLRKQRGRSIPVGSV